MSTEPRVVEVEVDDPPQTIATTAETRTTLIRLRHAKKLIRALLEGMHFDTDKTFLLPSAMKGIRQLRRFLAPRPKLSLLIVGHADTKGKPDHNLKLSEERARSILRFLRDDVDGWLTSYAKPGVSKPWGRIEDQHMLTALPEGVGPKFYSGPIHGKDDPPTRDAVKAFQRFSNETRGTALDDDGICGPLTRKELVATYMGLDGQTLAPEVVVAMHGCGEHHPEVATGDEVSLEANRRVEIFLFEGPATPPPVDVCPGPAGCAEYPQWRAETKFTIDLSLDPADLTITVKDEAATSPIEAAQVTLAGVDPRKGTTAGDGTVTFTEVIAGAYQVGADKDGFHPKKVPLLVGGAKAKDGPPPPATKKGITETAAADAPADADEPVAEGDATIHLEAKPAKVVELLGRPGGAAEKKPAKLGTRVVFEQGGELTLRWRVEGTFDEVLLEAGPEKPKDVTALTKDGKGTLSFKYAELPARADGTYRLVARRGETASEPKVLDAIGLEFYEVISHPKTVGVLLDPAKKTPMPEPVPGKPGKPPLDPMAKDTSALIVNKRDFSKKDQATGNAVRLRWSASLPKDKATVLLQVERCDLRQFVDAAGQPRPGLPKPLHAVKTPEHRVTYDVTQLTAEHSLFDPATFDVIEDCGFTFDAWLIFVEPKGDADPSKRTVLTRSFLRFMRDLPQPKILDFAPVDRFKNDEPALKFESWRDLGFAFGVNDTAKETKLVVKGTVFKDGKDQGTAFDHVTIKPRGVLSTDGKGVSDKQQFESFAPKFVAVPYDVEIEADLLGLPPSPGAKEPVVDHWPKAGQKLRIRIEPGAPPSPDLISIRDALVLFNGSPIDLNGQGAKPKPTWFKKKAECPVPGTSGRATAVWSWEHPGPGGEKVVVTDLRARVRDAHYASYLVAERVEWDPVVVTPKGGKPLTLPYDPSFFLEMTTIEDGFRAGKSGPESAGHYWKLRAHFDHSFQLVFGYEVKGGVLRPLDTSLGDPREQKLFPRCPSPAPAGNVARGDKNPVPDDQPLRVCVVVSLVTHREFNQFDPGGLLGAGRVYPMVLVLSNRDLDQVVHEVRVVRPKKQPPPLEGMNGVTPHACCHEMYDDVGAVLFSDTNVMRFTEIVKRASFGVGHVLEKLKGMAPWEIYTMLPLWANFFDYYDTDPKDGEEFRAATLDGPGTEDMKPEDLPKVDILTMPLVTSTTLPSLPGMPPLVVPTRAIGSEPEYVAMPVRKVRRQGEFDNVHQAPKMFVDPKYLKLEDNAARFKKKPMLVGEPGPGNSGPTWGLERVSMAPVCAHDCFHTHWRWSADFKDDFTSGWDGWDPYKQPGAPLIPPNQSLVVKLPIKSTLVLVTTMHGVEAGRWQVANHFGSGYGLAIDETAFILKPVPTSQKERGPTAGIDVMSIVLEEPSVDQKKLPLKNLPLFAATPSWSMFYWRLRFGGNEDQPMERLRVNAVQRFGLRQLGLSAGKVTVPAGATAQAAPKEGFVPIAPAAVVKAVALLPTAAPQASALFAKSDKTTKDATTFEDVPIFREFVKVTKNLRLTNNLQYIEQVTAALLALYLTSTGKRLLVELDATGKLVKIDRKDFQIGETDANTCQDYDSKTALGHFEDETPKVWSIIAAAGSGSLIKWDPKRNRIHPTESWGHVPPPILLGHELIHALHAAKGEMLDDDETREDPGHEGKQNQVEELITVGIKQYETAICENALRREWYAAHPAYRDLADYPQGPDGRLPQRPRYS